MIVTRVEVGEVRINVESRIGGYGVGSGHDNRKKTQENSSRDGSGRYKTGSKRNQKDCISRVSKNDAVQP